MGQGRERAINFLKDNPKISAEIEAKIRTSLSSHEDDDELLANIELVAQQG